MGALSPIVLMLLMFAVFYFILIRPQVKRQREQQDMLKKLGKGDVILTRGGLIGKISGEAGDVLVVELQEKVRVRIPRSYVEARWDEGQQKAVAITAPSKADKVEKTEKAEKAEKADKPDKPDKGEKAKSDKGEKAA
jgi:preprotein translocase subunit YajC